MITIVLFSSLARNSALSLFFSIIFIGFGYSQDNSSGSSGSPFIPIKPDSKKSLLNLKKKENPYLKKFEDKNKKNFFPDANVKEKKPERFINSNEFYVKYLSEMFNILDTNL